MNSFFADDPTSPLNGVGDPAEIRDLKLLGPRLRVDAKLLQQRFGVGRDADPETGPGATHRRA